MCTTTVEPNKFEHEVRGILKAHRLVPTSYYARFKQCPKLLQSIPKRIESNWYQENTLG